MAQTTLNVLPNTTIGSAESVDSANKKISNEMLMADPYGVQAANPVPQSTTGVSDTPAPTSAPSMVDTLNRIQTEGESIRDILNQRDLQTSSFEEGPAYDPFDEEEARRNAIRNQTRMYQAEIDATNTVYDQLLNEARIEGTGRLGSQRAIAARGGLLGSDFAGAQKQKVQDFNTDINRGIQAERIAAIGAIEGKIRDSVQLELEGKRQARQLGAEEYNNWLAGKSERKQGYRDQIVTDALTQGIDLTLLSEEELTNLAKPAGLTASDLLSSYARQKAAQEAAGAEADLETRMTEAEIRKIDADIAEGKIKSIGEGTMLYNTETGETFKNPKTYKPDSGSGYVVGGTTVTQGKIAEGHKKLNETRGEDRYADTGVYMDLYNTWVDEGGDPKDFIKEYDPDIYINPQDPTRSFLQTEMKKTTAEAVNEELTQLERLEQLQALRDSQ